MANTILQIFCHRKFKTGVPVGKGLLLKRGFRGGGGVEERAGFEKTDEKKHEFVTCRGVFELKKKQNQYSGFS